MLDEGDFEHLTISNQLAVVERAADGEPVVLIGSSLGGYLSALYAARHPEVERIVLMAPAFRFPTHYPTELGEQRMAAWKSRGTLGVFHYAAGRERELHYKFVEDGILYEAEPDFSQPGLIFHGRRDTVVPARFSREFVARRPNVELQLLPSGHELTDMLEPMWARTRAFLQL
jgi:pimeloyl-ACP methyl ester carboxylesterase